MKAAVLTLALASAIAHADEETYKLRHGAPAVIQCASADALVKVRHIFDTVQADPDGSVRREIDAIERAGECVEGPMTDPVLRLSGVESRSIEGSTYEVAAIGADSWAGPKYVLRRDLVSYVDPNKDPHRCTEPTSGEVDRLEVGRNGQLYLARYWVETKCVGGSMKSTTKPLN